MTKTDAYKLLAHAVSEFIHEGGNASALAGHDPAHVEELATALAKVGYSYEAAAASEEACKIKRSLCIR